MNLPDRDELGRQARSIEEQGIPGPRPDWLLAWDHLGEGQRESYRRIGEAMWAKGYAACEATVAAELARIVQGEQVHDGDDPVHRIVTNALNGLSQLLLLLPEDRLGDLSDILHRLANVTDLTDVPAA